MEKADLYSLPPAKLARVVVQLGEKPYRARQLFRQLHAQGTGELSQMTELPAAFRAQLAACCKLETLTVAKKLVSTEDGTVKLLFALDDGEVIESAVMRYRYGRTICISTQCGCNMGCSFCASTIHKKTRDLTAGEMLLQIRQAQQELDEIISNVVLMGIGEPLDNFENLIDFLEILHHPDGMGISHRHVTVSTCGMVPQIRALAEQKLQLTLAISLHAPDDETRSRLMPVNRVYPIQQLLSACRYYFEQTGRRLSFEYTFIEGVNDHLWQARMLASLLQGLTCHVNFIPVNSVTENAFRPGNSERMLEFQKILQQRGITATVRRTLGQDIDASCGQLRRRYRQNVKEEKG